MLIWKQLAGVIDLPKTDDVEKAQYFDIKSDVIVHHKTMETELPSKKVSKKNDVNEKVAI